MQALHTLRSRASSCSLTGRHQKMLGQVRDLFPFDGYVTLSGQYCFAGDQVLRKNPMPPQAVEELVAAAGDDAFSCIFLEGEDIYLNCINDLTRAFMKDLNLPLPPVRPASHALGREIYQPSPSWTGTRAPAAGPGAPSENHPLASPLPGRHPLPPAGKTRAWTPFWTLRHPPWRRAWPSATEKTISPCWSTPASA